MAKSVISCFHVFINIYYRVTGIESIYPRGIRWVKDTDRNLHQRINQSDTNQINLLLHLSL